MKRIVDSFWFQLLLGMIVLCIITLIMFDAVAIGVMGRSLFFDYYPK